MKNFFKSSNKNNNCFPMFMETKRMSPGSTNEWYIEVYGLECSAKFSTNDPNEHEKNSVK